MNKTATPSSADSGPEPESTPGLVDSLTQVNQVGQQTLDSATQALAALRGLLSADVALARSALRQALVWSAAVVVFATSAWLFLILALTVFMLWMGINLPVALSLSALMSLMATVIALNKVRFYLRHTDLAATRRQLAALHWPQTPSTSANTAHQEQTP